MLPKALDPAKKRAGSFAFLLLCVATLQSADPEPVKPTAEWSGSSENEALAKIAPGFLTSEEGFGIVWKAWGIKGEVPKVDFNESLVVVTTTRGGRLKVTYSLDEKDNLVTSGIATADLVPGFRYHLGVIDRAGIASVNGVVVPPLPRLAGPSLPVAKRYIPETTLEGKLHLEGSVMMSHLMELWAEGFQKYHPKLKITYKGDGAEKAAPEYAEGSATVAFMSRPVGDDELGRWEKKTNLKMMAFPVCEDEIALIVHKDNPIKQISMAQLKAAFGAGKDKPTWDQLGLADGWAKKPVVLHGRESKSGTRGYLRRMILGDAEDAVAKEHGSFSAVVEGVAADPNALGYVRDLFVKETVRSVPVAVGQVIRPALRRTCSIVVAVPNEKSLPPVVKEFLVYLYRAEGQTHLFQDGFEALNKEVINLQLVRLGLDEIK
jgi:phosphate transport system substrate-binding protein